MTPLRFISIMLSPVLLVLGILALTDRSPRAEPLPPTAPQKLDLDQAQVLEEGEGIEALETLHARWVLDTAAQNPQAGQDAMVVLLTHGQTESARQLAIEGMITLSAEDWPTDYRGDFLRALAPGALEVALLHDVPVSVTLAQAIQESGWGRSGLATQHNNLFGVKAGASRNAVEMTTEEVDLGKRLRIQARFRTFETWTEAVQHHGALLSKDQRYAKARQHAESWQDFLSHLAPIYASDPQYAQRVGWLIQHYDLDRWDSLVSHVASHKA